ncbi:hypothetical protein Micbo1qcDRAFT_180343 [Microdochium bolleyi]|uniref:Uncharacterized protein n=1 Tax=Microdochium bolleyi TaxID=196109 RepID=A0A136ILU8_9PEZI|nr:hypothetical protein Micbo1qcDRAFT_180343 [Microdochium bolleyi]
MPPKQDQQQPPEGQTRTPKRPAPEELAWRPKPAEKKIKQEHQAESGPGRQPRAAAPIVVSGQSGHRPPNREELGKLRRNTLLRFRDLNSTTTILYFTPTNSEDGAVSSRFMIKKKQLRKDSGPLPFFPSFYHC